MSRASANTCDLRVLLPALMFDLTSPPAEEEPRLGVLDLGGLSAQPRPARGAQDIGRLAVRSSGLG